MLLDHYTLHTLSVNDTLKHLADILSAATAALHADYFQLPVADAENPQYRERVYCYELYHLMRVRWPNDFPFSLAGEVDKSGHPLIRGNHLDQAKPDFIVHIPGDMSHNLLVVEVKAFTLDRQKIQKDLRKLTAFRRHANYHAAFYLFYGVTPENRDTLTALCRDIAQNDPESDLSSIDLLIHERPDHSAFLHPW